MIYNFTKSAVGVIQLIDEITTVGLPVPVTIEINDSALALGFPGELDGDQQTTLASVVDAHTPTPGYVSIDTKNQIMTLTGYLNNPSTAATARGVVVSVLAPNLPPNLLTTINTRIHALTGS